MREDMIVIKTVSVSESVAVLGLVAPYCSLALWAPSGNKAGNREQCW